MSSVSLAAGPAGFALFLTLWLSSPEGSALRTVLAIATTVSALGTIVAWSAKIMRTEMGDEAAILTHGAVVFAIGLMVAVVVVAGWYQDTVRSSARQQDADKQHQDAEASRAAQDEVKRQAQIAAEAAERAANAKDEAARQAAQAAAQICLQARDDATQKATKSVSGARKAVDDCMTQYKETLITFQPLRKFCKGPYARLDSAKQQLLEAKSRSCPDSTDATGSIDKPK